MPKETELPEVGHGTAGRPVPAGKKDTFGAASGKSFALAQESYPEYEEMHKDLAPEVVSAAQGDLLEVLAMHGDWAYGQRFRNRAGAVNEGVFRLEWVAGMKMVLENGEKKPVEVDIRSPEYNLRQPRASDAAAKLRMKRYRKKIDDASKLWDRLESVAAVVEEQEAASAAAAVAAAALEREAAAEKVRRQKAEKRRQQKRRKAAAASAGAMEAETPEGAEVEELGTIGRASGSSAPPRAPEMAWQAQWERQAALLEQQISSSSGAEGLEDLGRQRTTVKKNMMNRSLVTSLLRAKRSGKLGDIAEEWEKANSEMAKKASDMKVLNERVKERLRARPVGDLERIAEEMASEVERQAAEMQTIKERVFRAMLELRRARRGSGAGASSGTDEAPEHLEKASPTADMDTAQRELEMKALQLKSLMKRAWKGMVESRRSSELERIADEMACQFQTRAESVKSKITKALLRAHRAGELVEIRDELDELADVVPSSPRAPACPSTAPAQRRRWADFSSDSDSSYDPREKGAARSGGPKSPTCPSGAGAEADVSGSEAEGSGAHGSPVGSPSRD